MFALLKKLHRIKEQSFLLVRQRHKIFRERDIVSNLRHTRQARQNNFHTVKSCRESETVRGVRHCRIEFLQAIMNLRGQFCKQTAFDRLHNKDFHAVTTSNFITAPRLNERTVPIVIIQDNNTSCRFFACVENFSLHG